MGRNRRGEAVRGRGDRSLRANFFAPRRVPPCAFSFGERVRIVRAKGLTWLKSSGAAWLGLFALSR
jgi:hypothetical protein